MPSPGGQFLSDEFGDIEDYFISDYQLIDQYIGDQLWLWGAGGDGQLGTNVAGDALISRRQTPVTTFAGGTNWKLVSAGGGHTAAIKTDGTLWVWGGNGAGQLGINDTLGRTTPVTTFAGGTNWKYVVATDEYSVAIKTDGTLWTWGRNNEGQMGINLGTGTTNRTTPVTTILGGTDWKSVACGRRHTLAIKTDGTLWTWGQNNAGQLGINNATNKSTPVTTILGGTNWKSAGAGRNYSAVIKTDGTLWTWGENVNGQLGINDTTNRSTPVTTFAGGTNWKSVASGSVANGHFAAIKTDGTLWIWGRNDIQGGGATDGGQLGINAGGVSQGRTTPVTTFAGGTNWKQVSCGYYQTTAIKTDGTLWVWGFQNFAGQLGVNDEIQKSTPVTTFAGGTNWKFISAGFQHMVAVKSGLNVDFS